MLNCTNLNVAYYDGKYLYSYDRILKQTGDKIKFESIHPSKLPLIFILAGINKLGYKGMSGKGITTAIKYCVNHNINTVDDLLACQELKSIHKYVPIFFFDRYVKFLESIDEGVK
jgi:subtilase family serine protease